MTCLLAFDYAAVDVAIKEGLREFFLECKLLVDPKFNFDLSISRQPCLPKELSLSAGNSNFDDFLLSNRQFCWVVGGKQSDDCWLALSKFFVIC